jgi:hypothetical protein
MAHFDFEGVFSSPSPMHSRKNSAPEMQHERHLYNRAISESQELRLIDPTLHFEAESANAEFALCQEAITPIAPLGLSARAMPERDGLPSSDGDKSGAGQPPIRSFGLHENSGATTYLVTSSTIKWQTTSGRDVR